MSKGIGQRTPTETLIHRLRLMADSGGVMTKDRLRTVIEAADRLDEIWIELSELQKRGGDADEVH